MELYKICFKVVHWCDDYRSFEYYIKKGDTIVERLEKIERQIMPNGGSSMSDKIDYIRRDQNKMKQQVSEISGELKVIKDIVTVIVDK